MAAPRKLAAILVADVVGYSRLAGADEERTLARLRGLRSDLIDAAIAAHHGRIVKRQVPQARRRSHWTPQPTSLYDHSSHMEGETTVRDIQLKDAKASLSRLVDGALRGEEFAITRHGRKEAVVISWAAWERLSNVPSFGRLLASAPIERGDIPGRDPTPSRDADL